MKLCKSVDLERPRQDVRWVFFLAFDVCVLREEDKKWRLFKCSVLVFAVYALGVFKGNGSRQIFGVQTGKHLDSN